MGDKSAGSRQLVLWPCLYAILAAIAVFTPLLIVSNLDVLYLFIVAPVLLIAGVCVLIYAAVRRNLRIAVALAVFWAASAFLFIYPAQIRSPIKWLLWSSGYKEQVLAQPTPSNGDFKHVEWDGWGWAGTDTTIYLVFDPTDSLAIAAKSDQPGKYNGIPCKVPLVSRLESRWYAVQFYTDEGWGKAHIDCGVAD